MKKGASTRLVRRSLAGSFSDVGGALPKLASCPEPYPHAVYADPRAAVSILKTYEICAQARAQQNVTGWSPRVTTVYVSVLRWGLDGVSRGRRHLGHRVASGTVGAWGQRGFSQTTAASSCSRQLPIARLYSPPSRRLAAAAAWAPVWKTRPVWPASQNVSGGRSQLDLVLAGRAGGRNGRSTLGGCDPHSLGAGGG